MKYVSSLLVAFVVSLSALCAELGDLTLDLRKITLGEFMELYPELAGEEFKVGFEEEDEKQLYVSLVEKEFISQEELKKKVAELLKFNGLELRDGGKNTMKIVRILNPEETRRLNLESGRKWAGLEYAPKVRRVRVVQPQQKK